MVFRNQKRLPTIGAAHLEAISKDIKRRKRGAPEPQTEHFRTRANTVTELEHR
jgi:hypothetical protein